MIRGPINRLSTAGTFPGLACKTARRHGRHVPVTARGTIRTRLVVVLVASLLCADGLGAQTVLGTAVEAGDERPIAGAFVLLLDESGGERDRALTTARGTFRLDADRAGTYRLRLERIGFEDTDTEPFVLAANGTIDHRLTVASVPIRLTALRVEAEADGTELRCGAPDGVPTGAPAGRMGDLPRVWNEVEKALEATRWTIDNSRYRFDVLLAREARESDGTPISEPEYQRRRIHGRHPFRAPEPGFVTSAGWVWEYEDGELAYFGPDAETLLAEPFLRTHCFRLVRSDSANRRIVGIGFEPLPGREVADISGVLWVERASAKLLSLEFSYVKLPIAVKSNRIGGTIEFDVLPDGGWIVRSWEIRTPLTEMERRNFFGTRIRLTGLHHEGWRVLTVWRTGELTGTRDVVVRRYPPPPDP